MRSIVLREAGSGMLLQLRLEPFNVSKTPQI
jgi:hypothetical protein